MKDNTGLQINGNQSNFTFAAENIYLRADRQYGAQECYGQVPYDYRRQIECLKIGFTKLAQVLEENPQTRLSTSENKLKALTLWVQTFGKDHPDLALVYNNIGYIYGKSGNHQQALEYFLKALEIERKNLEENCRDLAGRYHNIAITYGKLNNSEQASGYFLKTLEIEERILRESHPDLAVRYDNVAVNYKKLDNIQLTLKYKLKALEIRERILGEGHRCLSTSYKKVAEIFEELEDHQKALEYKGKALETSKRATEKDQPQKNDLTANERRESALGKADSQEPVSDLALLGGSSDAITDLSGADIS